MHEIHDIESSLLDVDGSFRDLNFEGLTWYGVAELLALLGESYEGGSGDDAEGNAFIEPFPDFMRALATRFGHARIWGGAPPVTSLQVFLFADADGAPLVELTFYPGDLVNTIDLRADFINWEDRIRARAGARRMFARYENASWRVGDVGAGSGVFAVFDDRGRSRRACVREKTAGR